MGDLPLNKITTERVAKLCAGLRDYSRKTLGNILATLAKLLRTAVDWDVLPAMPCKIKNPEVHAHAPYVLRARDDAKPDRRRGTIDTRTHVVVLLGLHAGLRRGEILGLDWADVNKRNAGNSSCAATQSPGTSTRRRAATVA